MNKLHMMVVGTVATLLASLNGDFVLAADEASIVRGGRLYDNWSGEIKEKAPNEPHPAIAAKRGTASAAETWRCRECHGSDYKGHHGIVGIRKHQGADTATIMAILKDPRHRYDGLLQERDFGDIAAFVSQGQVDMQAAIEAARRSKAATTASEKVYGTICASCHGLDGRRLRVLAPLGDIARQRPHAALHVILNGHPGGEMPALRALGAEAGARVLVFLQSLPTVNLAVSIAHGGRLYDDWQAEEGVRQAVLPHPSYPPTAYYANDAQLTWRCRSCHGWDYQGHRGLFASGRNATGIKGIRAMAGADPARILAILRDPVHQYGAVLKERDLMDLANFVSAGQVDMDAVIDRQTRRVRGDAIRGGAYYRTICAVCHGTDGLFISTLPVSLGRAARNNPWESLHRILNGHPDEKMPALRELDPQIVSDILAHVQGLPESR